MEGLLLLAFAALLGVGGILLRRHRKRIARKRPWGQVWSDFHLRAHPHPDRRHYAVGARNGLPLSVWEEGEMPHAVDVVTIDLGIEVTLSRGQAQHPRRVLSGDPAFDDVFSAVGNWRVIAALLTPRTRTAIERQFKRPLTLRDGTLRAERPAGGPYDGPYALVRQVVQVAAALRVPTDLDAALVHRLRQETSPQAQRFWLHELERRRSALRRSAAKALTDASDPDVRLVAARVLADRDELAALVLDRQGDLRQRHEAFGALIELGRSPQLVACTRAALDEGGGLERDALRVWNRTAQGIERLLPRARHHRAHPETPPDVIEALVIALLSSKDARGVEPALALLETRDAKRQAAVLDGLGEAGRPEHLPLLERFDHWLGHARVREAAQLARGRIQGHFGDVEGAVSLALGETEGAVSVFDELNLIPAARSDQPLTEDD